MMAKMLEQNLQSRPSHREAVTVKKVEEEK
jgi:hypothetical protein